MFQYTPGYQGDSLNYAFLPPLTYQFCYLPPEQMYFMPPTTFHPTYDLLPLNHSSL